MNSYDDITVLSDAANHRVLRATLDGAACVLKQFDLRHNTDQLCFLNEVKRLKALCHPCVVDVQAAFVGKRARLDAASQLAFIQMPFYVGGDLEQ
jgi:hypothetical protein